MYFLSLAIWHGSVSSIHLLLQFFLHKRQSSGCRKLKILRLEHPRWLSEFISSQVGLLKFHICHPKIPMHMPCYLASRELIQPTSFIFQLFFSSWFMKGCTLNHFNAFHCFLLHFIVLAWSQWGSTFIVHAIHFRFCCSTWLWQLRGKN